MKILVIGSGGREHAVIWKLKQSPLADEIYCAPGNGGIANDARCVNIDANDVHGILQFSENNNIDLVVVTPENPLAAGLVDILTEHGIRAFGPTSVAAQIESSKVFSKNLMKKNGIPTAQYEVFSDSNEALGYLSRCNFPIVIKADGLALGKGVIIARDLEEARAAVQDMMVNKAFGEAGSRIIVEEFLEGQEVTVLTFTDGKTIKPMVSAQDHKKVYDNDEGPNTGGMGAFSPSRYYTPEMEQYCMERIFKPTVDAMNAEGRPFKGILYFGLILTKNGPKVLEYNARFGDPETQVILPRLKTDLVKIMNAVIDEELENVEIKWYDNAAACVIMASGGYPGKYEKGFEITGLPDALQDPDVLVFHAGTEFKDNKYYTAGGRVLGITAVAENLDKAIEKAYAAVKLVNFRNCHYRKDIGVK